MSDLPIINISTAASKRTSLAVAQIEAVVRARVEKDFGRTDPTEVTISQVMDGTDVWVARIEFKQEFFIVEGVGLLEEHLRARGPFNLKPLGRPPGTPDPDMDSGIRKAIQAYRDAPKTKLDDERTLDPKGEMEVGHGTGGPDASGSGQ